MASENVELVRSIVTSWEGGDFGSAHWADPEIEYVQADGPAPGSWRGLAGMAGAFRDWLSAWEGWRVEAEGECRELGADRVLVLLRFKGRGKASAIDVTPMETVGGSLFHIRDGRVVRLVNYWSRQRALADAGL